MLFPLYATPEHNPLIYSCIIKLLPLAERSVSVFGAHRLQKTGSPFPILPGIAAKCR